MMRPQDQIRSHFDGNMGRVMSLLALHGVIKNGDASLPASDWPDILRATVVLLHATLEDLLRSLAEWKLPLAQPESLEGIPFPYDGTKTQLTMKQLAAFRGRTVDSIIAESINRHLKSATYNDVNAVVRSLKDLQIDLILPVDLKSKLAEMMGRRHLIAHRADRDAPNTQGIRAEKGIDSATVYDWADVVRTIGDFILSRV